MSNGSFEFNLSSLLFLNLIYILVYHWFGGVGNHCEQRLPAPTLNSFPLLFFSLFHHIFPSILPVIARRLLQTSCPVSPWSPHMLAPWPPTPLKLASLLPFSHDGRPPCVLCFEPTNIRDKITIYRRKINQNYRMAVFRIGKQHYCSDCKALLHKCIQPIG